MLLLLLFGLTFQLAGVAVPIAGMFVLIWLSERVGRWSQSWNWEAIFRIAGGLVMVLFIVALGLLILALTVFAIAAPITYAISLFRKK